MTRRTTLSAGERTRRKILNAGVKIWLETGGNVTAHNIGAALNMTHSAVLYHYRSALTLRDAVARHAVEAGNSRVIMHLLAIRHPAIDNLDSEERDRHVRVAQAL